MRRERHPGKGVLAKARQKREHPRRPARHASARPGPHTGSHPPGRGAGIEWADSMNGEERGLPQGGGGFREWQAAGASLCPETR